MVTAAVTSSSSLSSQWLWSHRRYSTFALHHHCCHFAVVVSLRSSSCHRNCLCRLAVVVAVAVPVAITLPGLPSSLRCRGCHHPHCSWCAPSLRWQGAPVLVVGVRAMRRCIVVVMRSHTLRHHQDAMRRASKQRRWGCHGGRCDRSCKGRKVTAATTTAAVVGGAGGSGYFGEQCTATAVIGESHTSGLHRRGAPTSSPCSRTCP
jgi:hypothetical protein